MEEKGQLPHVDVTFETAKPTLSHLALVTLEQAGKSVHRFFSFFSLVEITGFRSIISHSDLEICVHVNCVPVLAKLCTEKLGSLLIVEHCVMYNRNKQMFTQWTSRHMGES